MKGVWTDPSAAPDDIVTIGLAQNLVDDPIASEAVRAAQHFGYSPDATYSNGIFDGYSIATGHEYAEAVTDPDNFASVQDG